MAPIIENQQYDEEIENTDLWKCMYPKFISIYDDQYDIDDYDGDRDELNDDFITNETNCNRVIELFEKNNNRFNIIDMIRKDCLVIQNWIINRNDDSGFDDLSFDKINTEIKIFTWFIYYLSFCEVKIVE